MRRSFSYVKFWNELKNKLGLIMIFKSNIYCITDYAGFDLPVLTYEKSLTKV